MLLFPTDPIDLQSESETSMNEGTYEQYNFSSLTFLCFKTEYKSIGLTKNVNVERNQLYLHCFKIAIDSASGIDHPKEN